MEYMQAQDKDIDVTQISEGEVFNTYPELCKALRCEVCGGNQKKKQLKEWQRYFNYEKDGNKFIITEVYNEPMSEEYRIAANAKYTGLIQNILLSYLSQQKQEVAYITQQGLWETFGMINERYMEMRERNRREELLNLSEDMTMFDINDFFKRSNTKFRDIVKVSLNSLKRRKLILFEEVYRVGVPIYDKYEYRGFEYRDATDSEKRYILKTERNLLKEFGFETDFQMFCSDKRDDYYDALDKFFQEEKGWRNVYYCYKFIYDKENIIEALGADEDVMKLNQLMVQALDTQADNNYNKKGITADNAVDRRFIERRPFYYHEGYPIRQRILTDNLIKR